MRDLINMEHTTIRNSNLFCLNCGTSEIIPYPVPVAEFSKLCNDFEVKHKDCPKTWEEPNLSSIPNLKERLAEWLISGDTGASSIVMAAKLISENVHGGTAHPVDPDDFGRCHKFLETFPELRKDLYKMSEVSPQWCGLINWWDSLTNKYLTKDSGMYAEMKYVIENSFSITLK